jgi:predicted transcriptional regulator
MWASQLRGARAVLQMGQSELAERSGVSLASIKRFEAMEGRIEARTGTVQRLMSALEEAGVQFIAENGGGPGVRLRQTLSPPSAGKRGEA